MDATHNPGHALLVYKKNPLCDRTTHPHLRPPVDATVLSLNQVMKKVRTYLYESLSAIAKRILSKELCTRRRRAARTFLEMPPERLAATSAKAKSAGTKFILLEIQMPIDCVRVCWQAPRRDAFASVLFCTSMSQRATPKVHHRRPYISSSTITIVTVVHWKKLLLIQAA